MIAELKNVVPELFDTGLTGVRLGVKTVDHPPRILMLYGSVRERSYSRLATEEAARLLTAMGADVRIFNPSGLLCRMMQRIRIPGLWNFAKWCAGLKGWYGALLNVMVR